MNAQEAERLSIEQQPIYDAEQKVKAEEASVKRLEELLILIQEAANKGQQCVFSSDGLQSTTDAFRKLNELGYYTESNYYGGGTLSRIVAWGSDAEMRKNMKRYEAKFTEQPKKKWWQIF